MSEGLLNVAVFMGGVSTEHEVSLRSGAGVVRALAAMGHHPLPVRIEKDGAWTIDQETFDGPLAAMIRLRELEPACVFIALHGGFGEDGHIQALLDWAGIPYTGSGSMACALALDKVRAKAVAQSAGVPVSRHVAFDIRSWRGDESEARRLIREIVGFPCVVKAPCQGSSVGLAMCSDEGSLRDCVEAVLPMEGRVMVEQYVAGREITASILDASEDGSLLPLPLIEIRPKHSAWFDYEAKYTPGASDEIVPAPIEEAHRQRIAELAVLAHEAIGCAGWSRSDFILRDDGTPVWLELNTVPGLTETSLFP
ncbi:MAG TPA: D-alanine--D-alanine ligase, partial [Candidatus Hydrogenedentes bacterium]|nr:D-alanine--D-alanine ligase [Candidatus Hydrogenedentota bacterium]